MVRSLRVEVIQVLNRLLLDTALRSGGVNLRATEVVLGILPSVLRLPVLELVLVPHHLVVLLSDVGVVHFRLESAHLLAPLVGATVSKAETLFGHLQLVFAGKLSRSFRIHLLQVGPDLILLTKLVLLLEFMVQLRLDLLDSLVLVLLAKQ